MKNKKGQFEFYIVGTIIGLTIISLIFFLVFAINYEIQDNQVDNCKTYRNLKLKAVNGIYDQDTGLLSGGSVSERTLLFENGLIMTLKGYEVKEVDLMLGKKYDIKKCRMKSGRITHKVLK